MTSISITTLLSRKRAVGERFGRAAASYDANVSIQTACGTFLVMMGPSELVGDRAVDLGCATASQAQAQQIRWRRSRWLGVDLSPDMLEQARKLGRTGKNYQLLCADAERLPLATASQALVFSSFALQWCRPQRVAAEVARVLMPGGTLMLCVPLAGSLQELADSWAVVDDHPHVNPLPTVGDWQRAFTDAGLKRLIWRTGAIPDHYPDVKSLTRSLQGSGVGHIPNRAHGLTGKSTWAAMTKAYERYRQDEGLPVTWQVLFAHLHKPLLQDEYH